MGNQQVQLRNQHPLNSNSQVEAKAIARHIQNCHLLAPSIASSNQIGNIQINTRSIHSNSKMRSLATVSQQRPARGGKIIMSSASGFNAPQGEESNNLSTWM